MGWRKFNEALDRAIPQKDDTPGEMIAKAVMSWAAAPMALLDLFDDEPSSGSGSSSGGQQSGGGGCHCYCPGHK